MIKWLNALLNRKIDRILDGYDGYNPRPSKIRPPKKPTFHPKKVSNSTGLKPYRGPGRNGLYDD